MELNHFFPSDRGPRQKVLLYMGSELNLPEAEHKLLAQTLDKMLPPRKLKES